MFLIQFQMSNTKFQINSAASRQGRISNVQKPNYPICLVQINAQPFKKQALNKPISYHPHPPPSRGRELKFLLYSRNRKIILRTL
jgi:hypothetical protein